jgi:putative membrane protein
MRLLSHLRISLIGFLMGCADVVPGVSGGTIAFICGIYDRLLEGIKSFDLTTLRLALKLDFKGVWARVPVLFFVFLGAGLFTAILTLARVLAHLMETHPVPLWSFFFGLILGSIVLLARQTWRWGFLDVLLFSAFALGTYWLVGLQATQTPPTLPFIFLAGAIAISAMILPGISGSYLLVIMGKYQQVLEAVNQRDFLTLGVFCAGIVTGVLSFVRIVSWLLRNYRHATLIALTGIMAGALRTVWPWKVVLATRINSHGVEVPVSQANVLPTDSTQMLIALGLALVGGAAVLLISRIADAERQEAHVPSGHR